MTRSITLTVVKIPRLYFQRSSGGCMWTEKITDRKWTEHFICVYWHPRHSCEHWKHWADGGGDDDAMTSWWKIQLWLVSVSRFNRRCKQSIFDTKNVFDCSCKLVLLLWKTCFVDRFLNKFADDNKPDILYLSQLCFVFLRGIFGLIKCPFDLGSSSAAGYFPDFMSY